MCGGVFSHKNLKLPRCKGRYYRKKYTISDFFGFNRIEERIVHFLEDIEKCIGKTIKVSSLLVAYEILWEMDFRIERAMKRANCLELP